ncbi:hypothetical protein [Paenibacillus sp. SI8]|uniref:hypothetical protein n=1 Tax=unclassified Paenibacillus TaxID=185978 RepID=UPI0034679A33
MIRKPLRIKKVRPKAKPTYKRAKAGPKGASATQNLGGGFTRFVFFRTITPNTFFTFTFNGGALKPISGGWFISSQNSLPAYATSNYSQNDTTWITTVFNPTAVTRQIAFTYIAKT